jgi:hypothetical protein
MFRCQMLRKRSPGRDDAILSTSMSERAVFVTLHEGLHCKVSKALFTDEDLGTRETIPTKHIKILAST